MTDAVSPVEWHVEVAAGCELGEHPLWDETTESITWVDVFGGTVRRLDMHGLESGERLGEALGAVGLRRDGGLVAAVDRNFVFRDARGVSDRDPVAAPVGDGMRFNDAACDPAGRFLAGIVSQTGDSTGELIQLHADGHIDVILQGLLESNGLAWSLDGETLYFVDSGEQSIRQYGYDCDTGKIGPRRANLIDFPQSQGTPDGLTIDAEGAVWLAMWGGSAIKRISPGGQALRQMTLPVSQPTCASFGSSSLDRLYVTSAWEGMTPEARATEPNAGDLFSANVGVRGTAAYRFRG
ncbi:SMP-30/gluconolactonase/LRE family protein [Alpinimonas psychrophila]|uniref:Sugar lactone lactonase YvrE n=1 Tax=Alpinimonas psychrophila TaxID=748908 RepID=A0A7W3JUT4_9MICO|nr:sugar lactone lactonase YvrE [Alpinimonas psychrophila]